MSHFLIRLGSAVSCFCSFGGGCLFDFQIVTHLSSPLFLAFVCVTTV